MPRPRPNVSIEAHDLEDDWFHHAACRGLDPNFFHPETSEGVAAARQVCQGCTVRAECVEYALTLHIHHGVWGGMSERQRRTLRAKRSAASAA